MPLWVASLVAAGGLIALLATVTAAVPSHLLLPRDGFADGPYRRLRIADRIRTAACGGSAALLRLVCGSGLRGPLNYARLRASWPSGVVTPAVSRRRAMSASSDHGPAPRTAIARKAQAYSAGVTPPFWIGRTACGWWTTK